jgi:hypothetical protein
VSTSESINGIIQAAITVAQDHSLSGRLRHRFFVTYLQFSLQYLILESLIMDIELPIAKHIVHYFLTLICPESVNPNRILCLLFWISFLLESSLNTDFRGTNKLPPALLKF